MKNCFFCIGFLDKNVLDDPFARFAAGCVDSFRLRGVDVGVFEKVRGSSLHSFHII